MDTGLPVINVSAFATGAAPGPERDEVAALLDSTCRETGFFLIDGHGVDPATRAAMFEAMRAFFAMPLADKEAIAIGKSPCHRGYVGIATEILDDKDTLAGDLKETLDTGGEHGPDHPEVVAGVPLFGPNQFPDLPGFREAWEDYRAQVIEAAGRVQRAMARALSLPDDFLLDLPGGETMYHLRLIHYPAQRTFTPVEGQLGCGVHTDYGTVTLLADDGNGGLQVMRRDGAWIDVRIPDGLLVVNLGDLMAIWTNDRWVSNPHRVINPPDTDRYSMPLFVTPPYHAEIACLESCLAPGQQPAYGPQFAGEYLMSRLDATHSYRNPLLAELNG
ncbi:isopenicillin N synthase family dioxygenase [Phytohabitans rumicis]|uniref:Oxidoreductase n=1 Tax=Phytohabitans rumicis TaxID=1076125 RepID=A0A6V8KXM1_9ACTN|nr:isopenicillin N synthase family oxygenase [Phytohabitans rumicis]GFJ87181.1 oxidoreductase [Phytohabitans rumicis]